MLRLEGQIDREYLSEISGGDSDFEKELVATFLDSAPGLIHEFRSALIANDAKAAVHTTHTLKGSSRSIGANPFALTCEAAEKAAREEDLDTCRSLVVSVETAFQVLSQAGHAFLDEAA
jgi:HPt (histidine-containing phosphotransfer) domain-containing protein